MVGLWFWKRWRNVFGNVSEDAKELEEIRTKTILRQAMKEYALIATCIALFAAGCSKTDDMGRGSSSTTQSETATSTDTNNSMVNRPRAKVIDTNNSSAATRRSTLNSPAGSATTEPAPSSTTAPSPTAPTASDLGTQPSSQSGASSPKQDNPPSTTDQPNSSSSTSPK